MVVHDCRVTTGNKNNNKCAKTGRIFFQLGLDGVHIRRGGHVIANCNWETRGKRREMMTANVIQRERVEAQDIIIIIIIIVKHGERKVPTQGHGGRGDKHSP